MQRKKLTVTEGKKNCSVKGCEKPSRSRGWCATHYHRWRRTGSTEDKSNAKHLEENIELRKKGKQRCTSCNRVKPFRLYHKLSKSKTGYRPICKACAKQKSSYDDKHANHILNTYGLSKEEYARLIEESGNKCWICGGGSTNRLSVDHNHKTGNVRGLLCKGCNRQLGRWRDNPDVAHRAAEYLELNGQEVEVILGREVRVPDKEATDE